MDDVPSQSELTARACRKRQKIATSADLVDLAMAAQHASEFVSTSTNIRLREIVEQMLVLKARAHYSYLCFVIGKSCSSVRGCET